MENDKQQEEWQRKALLTEYQVCQQQIESIGSQVWVSTTIFLTINVTLLGGLFSTLITRNIFSNTDLRRISLSIPILLLVGVTVLIIGIIWILRKWIGWLKRMRFTTSINYEREGEIEQLLGMNRHTMIRKLDLEYESIQELKLDCASRRKLKEKFKKENKDYKYFKASGFDGLISIAIILMVVWGFSTLILLAVGIISLLYR